MDVLPEGAAERGGDVAYAGKLEWGRWCACCAVEWLDNSSRKEITWETGVSNHDYKFLTAMCDI